VTSADPATRPAALGSRPVRRPSRQAALYGAALAGVAAAGLAFGLSGADRPRSAVALLDPGAATTWGLPISRLTLDVSLIGTIGLLVTSVLLPRGDDGKIGDTARRCLRGTVGLALVWAVSAVALLALLWSESSQLPITELTLDMVFNGPTAQPGAMRYVYGGALAAVIAAAAYVTRTRRGAGVVLLLAAYNVLPFTTLDREGQSSLVGAAISVHVIALSLWIGGLAGILLYVRRSPELLAAVLPRFNVLALCCFAVVGASGVAAAWMNLGSLSELRGSHYGQLVMYLAEALVVLGVFGWWHRRRTVSDMAARRSHAFTRYAAIEVAVVVATVSLGVALSRTPAPVEDVPPPTAPAVTY
jgi:putative copper export protein